MRMIVLFTLLANVLLLIKSSHAQYSCLHDCNAIFYEQHVPIGGGDWGAVACYDVASRTPKRDLSEPD
jgi:hypothetical protein